MKKHQQKRNESDEIQLRAVKAACGVEGGFVGTNVCTQSNRHLSSGRGLSGILTR
jgi:hypothetical protein